MSLIREEHQHLIKGQILHPKDRSSGKRMCVSKRCIFKFQLKISKMQNGTQSRTLQRFRGILYFLQ